MRKNLLTMALIAIGTCLSFTACSDSDENSGGNEEAANIDITAENQKKWAAYMDVVAQKLLADSKTLFDDWSKSYNGGNSYADIFKSHDGASGFNSATDCIGQIIDGCADIANEVGSAKIGDPYDLYMAGKTTEALYAVESWYSWHSIDDYSNNILSVRNALFGTRDGSLGTNSVLKFTTERNSELADEVKAAIDAAYKAIQDIPAPLRNNIVCQQTEGAMDACAELEEVLSKKLKPFFTDMEVDDDTDARLQAIVEAYVNNVVLPTYSDLVTMNEALLQAVQTFRSTPTDANLEACATAWIAARGPWETSEGFLFGPVADKGLDPNMDSWPLDQDGIVKIMNSGNYSALDWSGEFDEDSQSIAEAQSLRGYHTLEFLIFKDGRARTISAGR